MTNNDAGGPGVSDEEWARFVREAEQGAGQAPTEPSARARMVTERLRREDEQRAAAARGRFGRRSRPVRHEPDGWRTGPAWQDTHGGRQAGRRRLKATLAVVFIAGLALVVVRPELLIDRITGKAEARNAARTAAPLPAETVRPTRPPEAAYSDRPTLKEPFRGSPAAEWADGAAGIEVPVARAVGGMSAEQVAQALATTRELLIASSLDPATLRGERPEKALNLLDPRQADGRGFMERALTHPSTIDDPLVLFSRFDPAEIRVHGDVVKTRGRMTFDSGRDGEVRVHADYTFVYPVVRAEPGSSEVARTVVRRTLTTALHDPQKVVATKGKLQILEWNESAGNDDCTRDGTGYLHPQFESELRSAAPGASGPVTDPYDRSTELGKQPAECGTASRS